jgi:threonine/homoserine/homoserine lactone efflux protein
MTERLLLIIGVTTLCMLSPGPDMVLVMRNTLVVNRNAGGWTAFGILTGNMFHIAYCALGLGLLLSRSPTAYNVLRYASALYLGYLAIRNFKSRGDGLAEPEAAQRGQARGPYLQGLFNNLLNPKGILFYLGVFTQVITPEVSLLNAMILIATMVSVSAAFWVVFVQTLHLPAIRARLRRWNRAIDRSFGVLLLALAIKIALLE